MTYFVQGFEYGYGLIAAWQPNSNSTLYYMLDGDGLVTNTCTACFFVMHCSYNIYIIVL